MVVSGLDMFQTYTAKAGDVSRQFGLAGIALIWLLHGEAVSMPLASSLNVAFWCITVSLSIDIIQYIIGSFMWWKNNDQSDATQCTYTVGISVVLIFAKLLIMMAGYVGILLFLLENGFLR